MGAIKFFPVREVFGRQVTDTGTGRGQAAEPQGGGLDRNWKPTVLTLEKQQGTKQTESSPYIVSFPSSPC